MVELMTDTIEVDKKILYYYLRKTLHILNAIESTHGIEKVRDPELRDIYSELHEEFRE